VHTHHLLTPVQHICVSHPFSHFGFYFEYHNDLSLESIPTVRFISFFFIHSSSSESSLRPHTRHSSISLTHSHHLKNAQATCPCASSPCPPASFAMVQQRPSFYSVSRAVRTTNTGVCLLPSVPPFFPSSLFTVLTRVPR